MSSSVVPARGSDLDPSWTLLRWIFDAIVDGLALYAVSYYACDLYPLDRLPDLQTDGSDEMRAVD